MMHDVDDYPDWRNLPSQVDKIEEREWDLLVILDACRWDALMDCVDGVPEMVKTPAESSTPDWTNRVWNKTGWEDVTYVSANAFTTALQNYSEYAFDLNERVDEYVEVWREEVCETHGVPSPSNTINHTINKEPPVVAHFVQPHVPFLGDFKVSVRASDNMPDLFPAKSESSFATPIYRLVETGDVSPKAMRTAYMENLKLALSKMDRLDRNFDNIIVTADHGEALGPEEWSHGSAIDPRARIVPWYEW